MKRHKENFSDCDYEEKLLRQNNLRRKVEYGHQGHKGNDEPNPWGENAVRHYEDNK